MHQRLMQQDHRCFSLFFQHAPSQPQLVVCIHCTVFAGISRISCAVCFAMFITSLLPALQTVGVPGTEIVPISLADALDGRCTEA